MVIDKTKIVHLNRQIPPEAHTPMYLWHKYWSRKTWNVVSEFVKTYSEEHEIVFDPFAGSGVTLFEALKAGRRGIACDINPIATEIIRLTIKPLNEIQLYEAFQRVESLVKDKINQLYLTKCRRCGREIVFDCAIWQGNNCKEIRYQKCGYCADSRRKNCQLTGYDKRLLKKIEKERIKEWYPRNRLYYHDGRPFKEKQKYESVEQLFTKRNLRALATLKDAVEKEPRKDLREFLEISFSSMAHLCSKMNPISEAGHFTPFSSAWTQHSYWYPSGSYMEQNVWNKFESAITGAQGVLKAKAESNNFFRNIKMAASLEQFFSEKADVFIHTGSSLDLMEKMPENSVDYIFTDPPYDASIQFGELSYMWVSWLKMNGDYLREIVSSEIIRNEKQQKTFDVYSSLLNASFQGMFKVLKPDHFLTLTFHHPTFKVRNATIRGGTFAGFDFEKIHYQELARPSAKSLLQPFGSAQGDFYLRFHKPLAKRAKISPERIDETRFEKIVVETTIALLAERAEPTPYTIIINYIDPILAKHGFFASLSTGMDINSVLKKHLGKEFVLLPAKVGGVEGKMWWFKDTSIVSRLNEVPLTERVEQTVYRKLGQMGRVTFSQIWEAVSNEFPNSLTSDSMSILDALKTYARKVSGGYWLLKPEIHRRVNQHSEIVAILALVGKKKGYDVWVGKREQYERSSGVTSAGKALKEYMTVDRLRVNNANNQSVIENIDVIWLDSKSIKAIFEVESTTSMTGALLRGSNVDSKVDKFMVIPEERETQFRVKFSSPLFREHFEKDNWNLVYFDKLRIDFSKKRGNIDIKSIVDQREISKKKIESSGSQGNLF